MCEIFTPRWNAICVNRTIQPRCRRGKFWATPGGVLEGAEITPSLFQFGYDSNGHRTTRAALPVRGNTKGAYNQKRKNVWVDVNNEKLPKRAGTK